MSRHTLLIGLFSVVAFAALSLSGCSGGSGTPPDDIEVMTAGTILAAGAESTLTPKAFGVNLISNPGAEVGAGGNGGVVAVPSWAKDGTLSTVVTYGASARFPSLASPGRGVRGTKFFCGGPDSRHSLTRLTQYVDVHTWAADSIQTQHCRYAFNGWLGGRTNETDYARVVLKFMDDGLGLLSTIQLGPVTAANRTNQTKLMYRARTGTVPYNTYYIQYWIFMTRQVGDFNDGYADNLSLVLTNVP